MPEVYPVILYYKYVPIADPVQFVAEQRERCAAWGLKGRVLVAEEGINGTLAGPAEGIEAYKQMMWADTRFADVEFKISEGDETTFPKLVVKVRPEIVTLKAPVALQADLDNHLSPTEWKRVLEEEPETVVVDVRNRYEAAVGKFENALECDIEYFRELPDYVDQLGHLKEQKVLMYCTGGIRCEKASALFRAKGFKNVFQLHGGVANYQKEFGNEHWLGELFVFDKRMTVKVDEGLVEIGRCAHTGRPTARVVNCLHDPCHQLFILAEETERENAETRLCPECLNVGRTVATSTFNPDNYAPLV